MKLGDFKLKVIKFQGGYCAFPDNELLSGLVVQTDTLEEIPKAIARSFEVILMHGFKEGIHEIEEW